MLCHFTTDCSQQPLRMASMLRVARLINDTPAQDKQMYVHKGAMARILDMIADRAATSQHARHVQQPAKSNAPQWMRSAHIHTRTCTSV
jgi:hypothetical protein